MIKNLARYMRLYGHFVRFSLMGAMQFRFDFAFRILMDCSFYFVNVCFYKIVFMHTNQIAGWTESQVMLFMGAYLVIDAINMTVFANGTWMIAQYVNNGELDYYLLRPVSSFFFLSCRDFAFSSSINLLMALGILGWAVHSYTGVITLDRYVLFTVFIFGGTYLYHLMRILTLLPVFWLHSGRGFESLFWILTRIMERPDVVYTGWIRWVLMIILPFIVVVSFPTRILFQENIWGVVGYCVATIVAFHYLVKYLWNLGLRNYSSASS